LPLYEYRCKKCGYTFEKIQSFSAPEEKECPQCGAEVERLISAPAIQFKGAGWYVNDYAGKGSATTPAADSKSGGEKSAPADSAKPSSDSASSSTNSTGSSSGGGSTSTASKSD